MRTGLVGLALAAALLAGCGGGSDSEAAGGAEGVATPTAPSETPTAAVPVVSEKTVCDLVFSGDDQPMQEAVDVVQDFAKDPDPTELDVAKLTEIESTLTSVATRSPESLRPHLQAAADTMRTLVDAAENPQSGQQINFENFRASGIEIGNVCLPLL